MILKKRILSITLIAVLLFTVGVGCQRGSGVSQGQGFSVNSGTMALSGQGSSTSSSSSEAPTGEKSDLSIMVVLVGAIGASPGHDVVLANLQEYAEANPGVTVKYVESPNQASDWEPNYIAAAEQGYDLVISFTARANEVMHKVASNYPDTKFISVDNSVIGLANVTSVMVGINQAAFMMGFIAGSLTTRTEVPHINEQAKVGYVSGQDTPYAQDGLVGFRAGVELANPDCEIIVSYGDSFLDPVKLKELAIAQIESGADVLYSMAGAGTYGVIEACQEAGAYCFGQGTSYDETGEGVVIASWISNLTKGVLKVVEDLRVGQWHGDSIYLGSYVNGGLGLTDLAVFRDYVGDAFPQDIYDELVPLMTKVGNGEVVVPSNPDYYSVDLTTYPTYSFD